MNFKERIETILEGRKLHPWGSSLGLGRGLLDGISQGTIPKADALAMISRAENVRIDWLITGEGAPYLVSRFPDEAEALEHLEVLLEEEGWSGYVVSDGAREALVLVLPRQIMAKTGETVAAPVVEVLVGGGPALPVAAEAVLGELREVTVEPETLAHLSNGHLGTYHLLGWREQPGLLDQARPWSSPVEAPSSPLTIDTPALPHPTEPAAGPDRARLLELWDSMSPDEQRQALRVIAALREEERVVDAGGLKTLDAALEEERKKQRAEGQDGAS